ncbi:MAG: hypothetical protein HYY00_06215 [Chloroflexi bacterium]|nr:hypothetical protein [Chloroflexota bacterium]
MEAPERLGEVVQASTDRFTAQCYRLYGAPPLGSLVRAGEREPHVYGIVSSVTTSSLDPTRPVVARGASEPTEEAIYRSNPQLERLLRTDFEAMTVGHTQDGTIHQYLAPLPPHIHAFVFRCTPDEVRAFTQRLDFLPLLVGARTPPGDEVLAACLREAASAHDQPTEFLVQAGRKLALLLGGEMQRLNTILRRLPL